MCKIENCERKNKAKGLCQKHHYRLGITDTSATGYKHGMWKTTEYNIWRTMRQRCNNPNSKDYARYGGRGIKVCEAWDKSFTTFLSDMGMRPKNLTLDRINNDGDYTKDNCRWVTRYEQGQNR